jgi:hypothetical protein
LSLAHLDDMLGFHWQILLELVYDYEQVGTLLELMVVSAMLTLECCL